MKWWRWFVKADEIAQSELAARIAEARAAAAEAQTRALKRWPPQADLELEDYADRVAAALGRRRHR